MGKKETIKIVKEDVDFFELFFGKTIESFEEDSRTHKMLHLALEKAHDIRKFEIELYWKRATYFFAFFTVITAAFGYLFTSKEYFCFSPAAALVGSIISVCFIFVNIGSKYWLCNWEFIIDKLEVYVTGNLYKVYFYDNKYPLRPSVSDINNLISYVILIVWFLSFITSISPYITSNPQFFWVLLILYLLALIIISILCYKSVKNVLDSDTVPTRLYKFRKNNYEKWK
ncbi:hypothetical protein OGW21_03415 [Citrobacter sp. CK190]|uniref:RipA family octameric membrane protein n=1 Tax=Citrobacter TaxID=544 RepID=UPI001D8F715E|nr:MULTISPECIES: hypothetical protein [Citrobacter]MDM2989388.1 hypothetical protein [Citrobacter sp. CK190]MDT7495407.1 hypothetical protein [Citrobacter koseri]CAG0262343.1 hypothetical protein AN2351V1_2538 [Citrobacter koseri]CAH6082553.1 hypothetical protein AN2351V1_2538 [Citrobacter koseri]